MRGRERQVVVAIELAFGEYAKDCTRCMNFFFPETNTVERRKLKAWATTNLVQRLARTGWVSTEVW